MINWNLSKWKLKPKLAFWFLIISLIPITWIMFISYQKTKNILMEQGIENLKSINFKESIIIENYFRDREKIALALSKEVILESALQNFEAVFKKYGIHSQEFIRLQQAYQPRLSYLTDMLGFKNLILVTPEGEIVYSVQKSPLLGENLFTEAFQGGQLNQIFTFSKNFLGSNFSALTYYLPYEPPATFISVPLLGKSSTFQGVIILQLDDKSIFEFTEDYSGLGETGETLLVTNIDDILLRISPSRKQPNETISQANIIPTESSFGQFVKKILGGERLVEQVDDNGTQILAVGRYFLPSEQWGIITKIDVQELLAPIKKLLWLFTSIYLTTTAILLLLATNVANNIAQPILLLTKKTRLMTAGDLSQRIKTTGEDEIAQLGQSFNEMADQLNNMIQNLDSIVAQRTEEVELQYNQLEKTIDELKQTQGRLINQEKLASLGALTAGIAHEIRNPLNFINNFAELALQVDTNMEEEIEKIKSSIPPDDAAILHEYLETLKVNISKIHAHGIRADSIVKNMLQHSKGSSGEFVLTDVNAILDEYVTLSYHGMRAQDSSFNVKIEKDYDKDLPKIHLVPQEISRVFLNILNNAYYSVNKKQKELKEEYNPIVRISTKFQHNLVIIKIWDNGFGIPPDVFPKLFFPFFTTKPVGEGTGLGLSLSYNIIVQGHQGTLTAESEEGKFAEFIITLPVTPKSY